MPFDVKKEFKDLYAPKPGPRLVTGPPARFIAVRGQGLSGVLFESAVLLGFALVFFVIGVWRFRYE